MYEIVFNGSEWVLTGEHHDLTEQEIEDRRGLLELLRKLEIIDNADSY